MLSDGGVNTPSGERVQLVHREALRIDVEDDDSIEEDDRPLRRRHQRPSACMTACCADTQEASKGAAKSTWNLICWPVITTIVTFIVLGAAAFGLFLLFWVYALKQDPEDLGNAIAGKILPTSTQMIIKRAAKPRFASPGAIPTTSAWAAPASPSLSGFMDLGACPATFTYNASWYGIVPSDIGSLALVIRARAGGAPTIVQLMPATLTPGYQSIAAGTEACSAASIALDNGDAIYVVLFHGTPPVQTNVLCTALVM